MLRLTPQPASSEAPPRGKDVSGVRPPPPPTYQFPDPPRPPRGSDAGRSDECVDDVGDLLGGSHEGVFAARFEFGLKGPTSTSAGTREGQAGTATPGWKQALNAFERTLPAVLGRVGIRTSSSATRSTTATDSSSAHNRS